MDMLKMEGEHEAQEIAERIGTSAMAVRQHLYTMQDEKLVTFREEARPMGRPAKLWYLTDEANHYFPDAHATLVKDLIHSLSESFGPSGMDTLMNKRAEDQASQYMNAIPARASLKTKLERLVEMRSQEGYMAEMKMLDNKTYLFIENHCPICSAARVCSGLCQAELDVFQRVLGQSATIEREEHILNGARRCVYKVKKKID